MEKVSRTRKIIIAVGVILLAAVIALSVSLGITEHRRKKASLQLNNLYEKSYIETMTSLDNISTKLAKVSVLPGKSALRQQLLNDIWRECGVASTNLSQLAESSDNMLEAMKVLNQIGDYCQYLAKKATKEALSEPEINNLESFSNTIKYLNDSLAGVQENLVKGDKIDSRILADLSAMTASIGQIDYSSVDYPELIYDGPFSEGLSDKATKFLDGKEEITLERGIELIGQYFHGSSEVTSIGETSRDIPSYIYSFKYNGIDSTAYISKTGGYVVQSDSYSEITDPTLTDEECLQKAVGYMEQLGYTNMKPVWISNNNSTVYINFAYEENGVVYYPDLIKIKVRSDNGNLMGVEAQNFIYNHTARNITLPENYDHISVPADLTEKSRIPCLIPTDWNTEILCLEVVAEKNGQTYYIYYDLADGEEERVLLVIDQDGQLLI